MDCDNSRASIVGRLHFVHTVSALSLPLVASKVNVPSPLLAEFFAGDSALGVSTIITLCSVYRHAIAEIVAAIHERQRERKRKHHAEVMAAWRKRHPQRSTAERREAHRFAMQRWRLKRQAVGATA